MELNAHELVANPQSSLLFLLSSLCQVFLRRLRTCIRKENCCTDCCCAKIKNYSLMILSEFEKNAESQNIESPSPARLLLFGAITAFSEVLIDAKHGSDLVHELLIRLFPRAVRHPALNHTPCPSRHRITSTI